MSETDNEDKNNYPQQRRSLDEWSRFYVRMLLATAIAIYPGVYAWIWDKSTRIDSSTTRERIYASAEPPPQEKPATPSSASSGTGNSNSPPVSNRPFDTGDSDASDPWKIVKRRSEEPHISTQPLESLLDALVSAGSVTAKDADDFRKQIQTAALDGGKEITVDAAKALIKRFIEPHDETKETDSKMGELHAGGVMQVINNYCGAPQSNSPRRLRAPGPISHKTTQQQATCVKG